MEHVVSKGVGKSRVCISGWWMDPLVVLLGDIMFEILTDVAKSMVGETLRLSRVVQVPGPCYGLDVRPLSCEPYL